MKAHSVPSNPSRQNFLRWSLVTDVGQNLHIMEATYLRSALKLTYNQRILQVCSFGSETLYIESDFIDHFTLVDACCFSPYLKCVAGVPRSLPIATESIDSLILPHVLEFVLAPDQILQEAERILKPEGQLFILGINPLHPYILFRKTQKCEEPSWNPHFVSHYHILSWLYKLHLHAECAAAFNIFCSHFLITTPHHFWSKARSAIALGYAIKAIKRKHAPIPLQPNWKAVPHWATGQALEMGNSITRY